VSMPHGGAGMGQPPQRRSITIGDSDSAARA
jgi:hypothetical protein